MDARRSAIPPVKVLAGSTLILTLCASCQHSPPTSDSYQVQRGQVYASRASGDLAGDLYLPIAEGRRPAVVMIHGGGWRRGKISDMAKFARRVAGAGLVVFNVTYRLAPEHKFPAQLEDVRAAVRWLRSHAQELRVDPDRVGAWGYSAGAHLAMLLGTVEDDALSDGRSDAPSARVSAVVAGAGPTDLRRYPDNKYVAALMPPDADPRLFALASPLATVSGDDAATFFYHGRNDWIVGYRNSTDMLQALRSAGVPVSLYETPFGHIATYFFSGGAVDAGIEFLVQHLGNRNP